MADKKIDLEYNEHRLTALEKILRVQGKDIARELLPELDLIYEKYVPDDVRHNIESLISREEAEQRQLKNCFAVYHLHDEVDDYHFTDEFNKTLYDAVCRYCDMLKYGYKNKTVDTVAQEYFSDSQEINPSVFSVLCNTIPNDNHISALIEFDLEDETVSVCDSSDNSWRVYNLEDVTEAVHKVKVKSDSVLKTDQEIFNESLIGKEINLESKDKTVEFTQQM